MEDVLTTYALPDDPQYPVVCMGEASKQLMGEVHEPRAMEPGKPRCEDYEYEREGVFNQFVFCERLAGWRHVRITDRRTKRDWALAIRELLEVHYPHATKVRLVLDNLNTHTAGSLYETFVPAEARRLMDRLEFHDTPKHASWLNRAEIEIGILGRQCFDRRIDDIEFARTETAAWELARNEAGAKIHWAFTTEVARRKMKKLYPSIED